MFPARRSAGGGDRDGPPESRRPPGKRFYQCIGKDAEKPADAFLASRRKSVKMLFRLVIGTMRKAGPEGAGFSHLPLRQNGGRFPGLCPPCAGGSANEISHLRQAESKAEPVGPAPPYYKTLIRLLALSKRTRRFWNKPAAPLKDSPYYLSAPPNRMEVTEGSLKEDKM